MAAAGRPRRPAACPGPSRRANLLVEGVELPRAKGGILRIGAVRLEVTGQTYPCVRMEEARPGLLKALAKDWRGGVTCRVLSGGQIALGDAVEVLVRPPRGRPEAARASAATAKYGRASAGGAAKKPETGDQCRRSEFSSRRNGRAPFREGAGRAIYGAPSKSSNLGADAGRA